MALWRAAALTQKLGRSGGVDTTEGVSFNLYLLLVTGGGGVAKSVGGVGGGGGAASVGAPPMSTHKQLSSAQQSAERRAPRRPERPGQQRLGSRIDNETSSIQADPAEQSEQSSINASNCRDGNVMMQMRDRWPSGCITCLVVDPDAVQSSARSWIDF